MPFLDGTPGEACALELPGGPLLPLTLRLAGGDLALLLLFLLLQRFLFFFSSAAFAAFTSRSMRRSSQPAGPFGEGPGRTIEGGGVRSSGESLTIASRLVFVGVLGVLGET